MDRLASVLVSLREDRRAWSLSWRRLMIEPVVDQALQICRESKERGLRLDLRPSTEAPGPGEPEVFRYEQGCDWPFGFEAPSECDGEPSPFLASGLDGKPTHVTRLCPRHTGRWRVVLIDGIEPESFPGEAAAWEVMLR